MSHKDIFLASIDFIKRIIPEKIAVHYPYYLAYITDNQIKIVSLSWHYGSRSLINFSFYFFNCRNFLSKEIR